MPKFFLEIIVKILKYFALFPISICKARNTNNPRKEHDNENRTHHRDQAREQATARAGTTEIEAANIARIEAEDAERALVTALAHQVGEAVSALPEAASRIAKAATLVQTAHVWPLTSGCYLVG